MLNAERIALASDPETPTLVDGKLAGRIGGNAAKARPLLVGIVKRMAANLHQEGWRTLLGLRPGQRTPLFKLSGISGGKEADMPTASWFLKLAGGPRLCRIGDLFVSISLGSNSRRSFAAISVLSGDCRDG